MAWSIRAADENNAIEPIIAETPEGVASALSGIAAALSLLPPDRAILIAIRPVNDDESGGGREGPDA